MDLDVKNIRAAAKAKAAELKRELRHARREARQSARGWMEDNPFSTFWVGAACGGALLLAVVWFAARAG